MDGNHAAAELDDGSVIFGKSRGKGRLGTHAEEDLITQAESQNKTIVSLYSEREPCTWKCAAILRDHNPDMRISWSWDFNGIDVDGRRAIVGAIRAALGS